ncbi:hypothetical protein QL285_074405 [Trifolium repens]|nr:hypothetical protein QL285_074405 [Trifolium repens]
MQSIGQHFRQDLVETAHQRNMPKVIQTLVAVNFRDKRYKGGVDALSKLTIAVKLRYEARYVTLQLHLEVLEETKINPVRAWTFEAVTIPDCLLNLCFQKGSSQTSALYLIQLFEGKILHPRSFNSSGLKRQDSPPPIDQLFQP